ncbi:SURP and G-patch domain-containing protein 1, partial [Trichonephila inaurata madagascariensis]
FPVKIPRLSTTNQFKNDGSFLDQFRKMQESNVAKPDIKSDSSSTKSGIVMKIQAPESKTLTPTPAQEKLADDEEKVQGLDDVDISLHRDTSATLHHDITMYRDVKLL